MKIQLTTTQFSDIKADVLAFPIFEDEPTKVYYKTANLFLKENPKFGKPFETQLLYEGEQKILLVGAGERKDFDFERAQNISGTIAKNIAAVCKSVAIQATDDMVEPMALGLDLSVHDTALLYKSEMEKPKLESAQFIINRNSKDLQDALRKVSIVASGINQARLLGDMPANEMTPTYFLNEAKKIAKENKLKITVIDEKLAKKMGMGAFVGVAQGSEEPSFMIAMEYKGDLRSKEKWGLVGKGITFDSGGTSIKPSEAMHEMKYDMSGAGAVLATLAIISRLKLKINVVGVMAVTENLPGGRAQRPGDIIKTYSGKTAEVLNTDAEGRLVLVDAITVAQKDFKVTKLIDLATLTGAVIVALGDVYAGIFSNNPEFAKKFIAAGKAVGEKYWEFPMDKEYGDMIKSDFADIANLGHGSMGTRGAGPITGAKFIEAVVEDNRPWIHVDIAGVAWDTKAKPYRSVGATGFGIKTLVELISKN